MMAFVRATGRNDVATGTIQEFQVGEKNIALANVAGKFFAINNVCLHQGGPLGEGDLDRQVVTCPWHGWQFDVTNGQLLSNSAVTTTCYSVEIRGDDVFVDVG
jgi:nitrite reductase/ring-hydroxylating ferredoxin subunit